MNSQHTTCILIFIIFILIFILIIMLFALAQTVADPTSSTSFSFIYRTSHLKLTISFENSLCSNLMRCILLPSNGKDRFSTLQHSD